MSLRMIPYAEKQVHTEDGSKLMLSYFVVADTSRYPIRYGVKVSEKNSGDDVQLPNLTMNIRNIYDLIEKLVRETVTPTSLPDVVADWL